MKPFSSAGKGPTSGASAQLHEFCMHEIITSNPIISMFIHYVLDLQNIFST